MQHIRHCDAGDGHVVALGDVVEDDGDGLFFASVDFESAAALFGVSGRGFEVAWCVSVSQKRSRA